MTVIDFPPELKLTGFSLTADDNAGQETLPFSGTVQRLASTYERFRATWDFRPPAREESLAIEAFFLRIGSGRSLFRTLADYPCRSNQNMAGAVSGDHAARSRTLAVAGLIPNRQIKAGEWVQVGWQASRIMESAFTDSSGAVTLSLFPFLHAASPSGTKVRIGRWVKVLWRMTGEPVNWAYQASRQASLTVSLAAQQEIVTSIHDLSGEEVPD